MSDKNKIKIVFGDDNEEFISFMNNGLSKYQQFINDMHSALVSDMVIPKDTEYLSNAFTSITNINQQRKKNIFDYGDVVFLKQYESDTVDHHLCSVLDLFDITQSRFDQYDHTTIKQFITEKDIGIFGGETSNFNIAWYATYINSTMFTINDFPYVYLTWSDFYELSLNDKYMLSSTKNIGDLSIAIQVLRLTFYKEFIPSYILPYEGMRLIRTYSNIYDIMFPFMLHLKNDNSDNKQITSSDTLSLCIPKVLYDYCDISINARPIIYTIKKSGEIPIDGLIQEDGVDINLYQTPESQYQVVLYMKGGNIDLVDNSITKPYINERDPKYNDFQNDFKTSPKELYYIKILLDQLSILFQLDDEILKVLVYNKSHIHSISFETI